MNDKIDKIFGSKLKDYEKAPSSNAWEKLNDRLERKERKKGVGWYSVAAGLIFFISSILVYLSIQKQENYLGKRVSVIQEIERIPEAKQEPKKTAENQTITSIKNEAIKQQMKRSRTNKKEKRRRKEEKIERLKVMPPNIEMATIDEEIKKEDSEKATNLRQDYNTGAITVVIKRSSTSITNNHDTIQKDLTLKTRLAKVYTQFLNLKNGEKVNLGEFTNLLATNKKGKQTQDK